MGFASPQFGALKVGKTDAPYKQSTISLNPFSAPAVAESFPTVTMRATPRVARTRIRTAILVKLRSRQGKDS